MKNTWTFIAGEPYCFLLSNFSPLLLSHVCMVTFTLRANILSPKQRVPFMLSRNNMVKVVGSENSFSSFYQKELLCEESPSGLCEAVNWPFLILTIQLFRRGSTNKISQEVSHSLKTHVFLFPSMAARSSRDICADSSWTQLNTLILEQNHKMALQFWGTECLSVYIETTMLVITVIY